MSRVSSPIRGTQSIAFREIVLLAIDSFRLNQVRFALTALGMVIGTASLILVVTIGLSGRQYVLTSIQNIGTNLIWAEYAGLSDASIDSARDYLTVDDMRAVEQQVPGIQAASPVVNLHQSFTSGGGKERDVLILGVNPDTRHTTALSDRGTLFRSAGLIDPQPRRPGHGEVCFDPVRQPGGSGGQDACHIQRALRDHRHFSRAICHLRAIGNCR